MSSAGRPAPGSERGPDPADGAARRLPEAAEVADGAIELAADLPDLTLDDLRDVAVDDLDDAAVREEVAAAALASHTDAVVRAETAREGLRRVALLAGDLGVGPDVPDHVRRPPLRLRYPRYGWRRAVRLAVERRMVTPQYLRLYQRALWHRARAAATGQHVEFQGMTFTGRRVEFRARQGHGRLVVGPWCWIGDDNKLRAHEGQLTLGAKVVMGRDNVINTYLDVEVGDATILADWIYVCDFDHRYDRLDVPIKDQGIATSPVRIGGDVWIGEKASVLRGVDVGQGAIVASHCLVNRDVPPFAIVVGVPARVVKSRLPAGMDPEEAAALVRHGLPIPGDPLET